jgi:hypothetical protein
MFFPVANRSARTNLPGRNLLKSTDKREGPSGREVISLQKVDSYSLDECNG